MEPVAKGPCLRILVAPYLRLSSIDVECDRSLLAVDIELEPDTFLFRKLGDVCLADDLGPSRSSINPALSEVDKAALTDQVVTIVRLSGRPFVRKEENAKSKRVSPGQIKLDAAAVRGFDFSGDAGALIG